jgi:hypothetical protein
MYFATCENKLIQLMRDIATLQKVLPLEVSREVCNPHQVVYLTDVVECSGKYRGIDRSTQTIVFAWVKT